MLARRGFDEQRERGSTAGTGFALAIIAEAQLVGGDIAGARTTLADAAKLGDQLQDPAERAALDQVAKRLP